MFKECTFSGTLKNTLYFNDWGPEDGNPVVCVHGLTGNGFDFDYLAADLVQHGHRVVAVDLAGRGRSDFLDDPLKYNYDQYLADLYALLDHLDLNTANSVDWIGVSLGGLLGYRIAGEKNSPIKRMIVNDVGPTVPQAALDFIAQVISQKYTFADIAELELRMRQTRGLSWGPVTNEQWAHMAKYNARAMPDGRITYAYDQHISKVFESAPVGDVNLWPYWENIRCPMLVIRGGLSLLFTPDIVHEMRDKGPEFDFVTMANCGHVPSLMAPEQIEILRTWLNNSI